MGGWIGGEGEGGGEGVDRSGRWRGWIGGGGGGDGVG